MLGSLENLHPRSLLHLVDGLQSLIESRLWLRVLIGLVLGVGVGVALGPSAGWISPESASRVTGWLVLPGHIFLATIQMIVVPLVFASIIGGLASSESAAQLRRIGVAAALYFTLTTLVATVVGLSLGLLFRPGRFIDRGLVLKALEQGEPEGLGSAQFPETVPEAIVSLIPTNPLGAMVESQMLQVVVFAIVLGVALVSLPAKDASPLLGLLASTQRVCMTVVGWAMKLAPLAVFGLMARLTSQAGLGALFGLLGYVATVLAGLAVLLVIYVFVAWLVGGRSPGKFLRSVREVQLLAFSTSSSAAVMPLSVQTAEEKLGVRPSTAQLIIPLGATVNMDGTALYQSVATVFLAQAFGVDLTPAELGLVVVTSVAASIGSPAAPGVGIMILAMILGSVGIPAAGIALIVGVDRLLDMSRTSVNVTSDLVASTVLDRLAGTTLAAKGGGGQGRRLPAREESGTSAVATPSSTSS